MITLSLMDSLEDRFKHLQSEKGLSYKDLAQIIGGISGDAIRKAVQRNNLKGKYLQTISDNLGISRSWLETGVGVMNATDATDLIDRYSSESGMRLIGLVDEYIPEEMQDVVKKLKDELADLYEYKELYYKAKEAYRPK